MSTSELCPVCGHAVDGHNKPDCPCLLGGDDARRLALRISEIHVLEVLASDGVELMKEIPPLNIPGSLWAKARQWIERAEKLLGE